MLALRGLRVQACCNLFFVSIPESSKDVGHLRSGRQRSPTIAVEVEILEIQPQKKNKVVSITRLFKFVAKVHWWSIFVLPNYFKLCK